MKRTPEPELMDSLDQARAYAEADFEAAHAEIARHFGCVYPQTEMDGLVIDLGCGPADISVRFARLYPLCRIDAVDGSDAMLSFAKKHIQSEGLEARIRVAKHVLPDKMLGGKRYDGVISNSLLHHLHAPLTLWTTIKQVAKTGAFVYVADLTRPESTRHAAELVQRYSGGEPKILRSDFYNSLLAAFTPEEITQQLAVAGLSHFKVERIGDRHVIAYGNVP